MEKLETTIKMYSEIMEILHKYEGVCIFDIEELERKSKIHIYGIGLKEKFGFNIDPKQVNSLDYNKFGEYKTICWFGKKYRRSISWSVDGRQPEDKLLLQICFPTGAYIFGDGSGIFDKDYPTEFFQKFWLELKTYNADYIDEVNHSLYWKLENAKEIFNSFEDVLKKYYELNKADIKQRRIEKMKKELENLEKAS